MHIVGHADRDGHHRARAVKFAIARCAPLSLARRQSRNLRRQRVGDPADVALRAGQCRDLVGKGQGGHQQVVWARCQQSPQVPGQSPFAQPAVTGAGAQGMKAAAGGRRVAARILADDEIHFVAAPDQAAGNLGQGLFGAAAGEVGGEQRELHGARVSVACSFSACCTAAQTRSTLMSAMSASGVQRSASGWSMAWRQGWSSGASTRLGE